MEPGGRPNCFAALPVDYVDGVAGEQALFRRERKAADGSVASSDTAKLNLRRNAAAHQRKRDELYARRWYRQAGCNSLQDARGRARRSARSRDEVRRSL